MGTTGAKPCHYQQLCAVVHELLGFSYSYSARRAVLVLVRNMISGEFNLNMLTILIFFLVLPTDEPAPFHTGKDLQTALATNISWFSIGSELGIQLRDLQAQTGVVILRDRRIDPHQAISVKTDFVPRVQVLNQISSAIPQGAFCATENFVCVGPAHAIYRLPILLSHNAEQVNSLRQKIDAAAFRKLTAKTDASWERLSEPRQMLLDHAVSAGAVIRNPDVIPHDVWAEVRLPRMSFSESATMILNQFDLTFKLAGDRAELTIVPIDPEQLLEHRYTVGSKFKATVVTAWQQQAPTAEIEWTGSNATVTTTLRQHAALNATLQELLNAVTSSDATSTTPDGSIRTRNFQIKAERATIGQLIDFFREERIRIELVDKDSPEVLAILSESVQLDTLGERQPGSKLFPLIFGTHFKRVDVQDDRVVLSRE